MTRSKPITLLAGAAALLLIALGVAACGGGGGNDATASSSPPQTASGSTATVGTASAGSLGTVLVDSQGNTLYFFQKDTGTKSTCVGACATSWPPLRASGKPTAGSGATASMLGTTPRTDGKPQVTYNGHPLYTFSGDQSPGDVNGQGVNAFGALWYAASPAGNPIVSKPSSSSSSGGGGFSY